MTLRVALVGHPIRFSGGLLVQGPIEQPENGRVRRVRWGAATTRVVFSGGPLGQGPTKAPENGAPS